MKHGKKRKASPAVYRDRPKAWLVCAGSIAKPHRPLFFTTSQAEHGCPYGCFSPMVNKAHGNPTAA